MSVMNPHNLFRRWLKEQFILKYKDRIEELMQACGGRPFIGSAVHEFADAARIPLQYTNTGWREIWYALICNYLRLKKRNFMTIEIPTTEENYLSLRKAYRQAVEERKEDFTWEDQVLVTNFVKYVLEHMEMDPIIKPLINEPD